jgi:putative transposase
MSRDTTVIPFRQPEAIDDPLGEVAREGARRMLAPLDRCDATRCAAVGASLRRAANVGT